MTFDVFGDFEARGYLRNLEGLKDLAEVKRLEHRIFLKNLGSIPNNRVQVLCDRGSPQLRVPDHKMAGTAGYIEFLE